MTNPIPIPLTNGAWVKSAAGAQKGSLYLQELDPNLNTAYVAFNDVGDGNPPVDPMKPNSTAIQVDSRTIGIDFNAPGKDVYIWATCDGASVLPSISVP